ncbi:putative coat protein [Water chestnut soymovirus 1]|uniref:Coat protein n=1 Tax=Water chestnut soymovirus 1 TaxID=1848040 RepID=A0A172PC79_9VIRU|nr:putative coat protein [Water chestnut soymovirus 1]AND65751.1 putative coat protein [Water chestnut soymovirus 1]
MEENIEKLVGLMEKLELISEPFTQVEMVNTMDIENEDLEVEENQIIYNFDSEPSSDDSEPMLRMGGNDIKQEKGKAPLEPGSGSKGVKGKDHWPQFFEEREREVRYGERSWEKLVPYPYRLREGQLQNNALLNIDCTSNTRNVIYEWINHYRLMVNLHDERIEKMTLDGFFLYLQYHSTGIVKNYLGLRPLGGNEESKKSIKGEDKLELLQTLLNNLLLEFCGVTEDFSAQGERDVAKHILINMQLCDPCYLENFFCQVREYYYRLSQSEKQTMIDVIIQKLPKGMRDHVTDSIKENNEGLTLGMVELHAKDYRRALCDKANEQREVERVRLRCCNQLEDVAQKYGCRIHYPHRKKHFKHKEFRRKNFHKIKTYKKPWKPKYKKYFKKRRMSERQRNCPSKKKNCKCWLCQKEGHYANECPEKQLKRNQVKQLEEIQDLGFDPIEDELSEGELMQFDYYKLVMEETTSSEEDSDESDE